MKKILALTMAVAGSFLLTVNLPALAANTHVFGSGIYISNSPADASGRADCQYLKDSALQVRYGASPLVRWFSNQYSQCGNH